MVLFLNDFFFKNISAPNKIKNDPKVFLAGVLLISYFGSTSSQNDVFLNPDEGEFYITVVPGKTGSEIGGGS